MDYLGNNHQMKLFLYLQIFDFELILLFAFFIVEEKLYTGIITDIFGFSNDLNGSGFITIPCPHFSI